jgi:hypothetical protein
VTTMQELVEVRADWFEQARRSEFQFRALVNRTLSSGPHVPIELRELKLLEAVVEVLDDGSGEPPPYDDLPSRDLPTNYLPDGEDRDVLDVEGVGVYYDDNWGGVTREVAECQQKIWRRGALRSQFLDELHDLLCSDEKYREERKALLSEYRTGQTAFAAGVATALAPYVGGGAQFLITATATSLTIIGQVGLKSWCALQSERRRQHDREKERRSERREQDTAGEEAH